MAGSLRFISLPQVNRRAKPPNLPFGELPPRWQVDTAALMSILKSWTGQAMSPQAGLQTDIG